MDPAPTSPLTPLTDRAPLPPRDEVVVRYSPLVVGVARSVGLSVHEAEDVAQAVWERLLTKGHTIRNPDCLPGWLKTCARREAQRTSIVRQRSVLCDQVPEPPTADSGASEPEAMVLEAEGRRCVGQALDALTGRQSSVLRLVASGYSYRETSRHTGVPVPSIGPTMQRGLRAMGRMAVIVQLAQATDNSLAMASAS
jgi:RNA polymerase sigma factor (sigma-70 family)